jgi:hypothetical protein
LEAAALKAEMPHANDFLELVYTMPHTDENAINRQKQRVAIMRQHDINPLVFSEIDTNDVEIANSQPLEKELETNPSFKIALTNVVANHNHNTNKRIQQKITRSVYALELPTSEYAALKRAVLQTFNIQNPQQYQTFLANPTDQDSIWERVTLAEDTPITRLMETKINTTLAANLEKKHVAKDQL